MSDHLKPIVEALIFASPDPVTPKTLYKLLECEPREDVDAASRRSGPTTTGRAVFSWSRSRAATRS